MVFTSLVVLLGALVATSSSQETETANNTSATVWGSVVVMNHGERTPLGSSRYPALTPQGALQMREQGRVFRSRYLASLAGDNAGRPASNITDPLPIQGLGRDAIDNSNLALYSLTEDAVVAGAVAFMQGLYPPDLEAFPSSHGGADIAMDIPADANYTYPLGGYQYPAINTLSIYDERSIMLQGHATCWNWQWTIQDVQNDPLMQSYYTSSQESYDLAFKRPPLAGAFPDHEINFFRANELYDYAQYEYDHNKIVYDGIESWPSPSTAFETLGTNARRWQQALHANAAVSGLSTDDPIRTIAGSTLAGGILDQLRGVIGQQGEGAKLSVLFTSSPSLLSFFALAGLRTAQTTSDSDFFGIPDPAAAMAFEVVGDEPGRPGVFPDEDNLWVRFMWRRNSDPDAPLVGYELFRGAKNEYVIPWSDFRRRMADIAIDVSDWCDACASETMVFCRARSSRNGSSSSPALGGEGGGVHNPVVAGVIGAVVTLAVVALVMVAAAVFGGVRMYRRTKDDGDGTKGAGGFKGAEKMASDADLSLGRGGIRHERMGSWELRSGGDGGANTATAAAAQHDVAPDENGPGYFGAGLSVSHEGAAPRQRQVVDDDGVSALSADIGGMPVRPRESI